MIHSQIRFRLTIDTGEDGIEAWQKDFLDLNSLRDYLQRIAPEEGAKIDDFTGRSESVREGHTTLEIVPKRDFSADGFAKLPRG
jgi:hypothetical protein